MFARFAQNSRCSKDFRCLLVKLWIQINRRKMSSYNIPPQLPECAKIFVPNLWKYLNRTQRSGMPGYFSKKPEQNPKDRKSFSKCASRIKNLVSRKSLTAYTQLQNLSAGEHQLNVIINVLVALKTCAVREKA